MNRKIVALTAIMLLSIAVALAQTSATSGSSTQDQSTSGQNSMGQGQAPSASSQTSTSDMSPQNQTVEGCLSGSNGNYTLTDQSGKAWQLTGNTNDMSAHVGHEIEITGAPSGTSASASASSSGSTAATSSNTFNVTSMRHISEHCTNPSAAATGTATNENAAAGSGTTMNPATGAETTTPVTSETPASSTSPTHEQQHQMASADVPGTTNPGSGEIAGADPGPASSSLVGGTAQGTELTPRHTERVNSAPVASNTSTNNTATAQAAAAPPAPAPAPESNEMAQAVTPPPPTEQSNQQTEPKTITDMSNQNLPQTGSELPLLAVLGLGTLGTGVAAKFRKRSK